MVSIRTVTFTVPSVNPNFFSQNEITSLIEHNNKYFLIGVTKTENINKRIENISTKKEVILDLERKTKRIFISEFMAKINKNEFNKSDFDKLSKDENVNIQKINLDSRNDNKILKKDVINQVYSFPENKLITSTMATSALTYFSINDREDILVLSTNAPVVIENTGE